MPPKKPDYYKRKYNLIFLTQITTIVKKWARN